MSIFRLSLSGFLAMSCYMLKSFQYTLKSSISQIAIQVHILVRRDFEIFF